MIVTIGGAIGSGKTTVAKALAEKLNFAHISAGEIFRSMAERHGMTLPEFSKFAEGNHKLDKELDAEQMKLAKKSKNAIIDGRLSGWLLDADLKIWLKAPLEVRARRVAGRENKTFAQALKETKEREKSEWKRYREIYKIDLNNLSPYDVVLNTNLWSAEKVVSIIENIIGEVRR